MKSDRRPRGTLLTAATTLSGAASVASAAPARRPRLGLILGAAAVIAGSAIGSALALRLDPAMPAPPDASPRVTVGAATARAGSGAGATTLTAVASARTTGSATTEVAAPPVDRRPVLIAQMKDALVRFVAWASAHPAGRDARCPDAAALGAAVHDPWGQPLRIVCANQPADQIAGVHSLGPDGLPGTRDDVVSWELGADVTDLVRGRRWTAGPAGPNSRRAAGHAGRARPPAPRATTPAASPPSPPPGPQAGSDDVDNDGIPDRR